MNAHDLKVAVSEFVKVLESCEKRIRPGAHSAVRALCELYAVKSANKVFSCLGRLGETGDEIICNSHGKDNRLEERIRLPSSAVAQSSAREMIAALESNESVKAAKALQEMRLFMLSPMAEWQFAQLENRVESVIGRAQLIPLVELSIFALESEEYQRAGRYAVEAYHHLPGPSQLHDLYTVEGAIALHSGDDAGAKKYLAESIAVCMADELACLTCGVRAPNLALASRLLEQGGKGEVVAFLAECRDVWDIHKEQFERWIGVIRDGGRPDFRPSGVLEALNNPSVLLGTQCTLATHLDETPHASAPKSKEEAMEGRLRLRAAYKHIMKEVIAGKLGTSNN